MIPQSSRYFLKIFLINLLLQALNEVSLSNIFLVFFCYIWSSKVNSIFIISGSAFWSVNSISIGSFSFSSFFSEQLLLYLIKVLAAGLPVAKFYGIYLHCVFLPYYTGSDNSNVISIVLINIWIILNIEKIKF